MGLPSRLGLEPARRPPTHPVQLLLRVNLLREHDLEGAELHQLLVLLRPHPPRQHQLGLDHLRDLRRKQRHDEIGSVP